MANTFFESKFKKILTENKNHLGEPTYQLYSSWIRALRKRYPNVRIEGDKDIANAFDGKISVGEWDGVEGSIYVKRPVTEDVNPNIGGNASGGQTDAAAWEKSLGTGSKPEDFGAASNPQHGISKQNIEVAKDWVRKIDEFKKFINGLEPDSLHSQMNSMDRDGSVFRGIIKSESRKIIKIAEALGSFNEILRSYIIGSDKKARELQAQTSKLQ